MRVALALFLLGTVTGSAAGQTIWSRPYTPNLVVVEAVRPEVPGASASVLSGATFLTATHSFTDHVELAAELPLARTAPQDSASASAVGNPYLGVGLSSTTVPVLVELGVRLPVASPSSALRAGTTADMGRTRAFAQETFSVSGLANTRFSLGRTTSLRLRVGPIYTPSPRDTTRVAEPTWHLHYSAQLWREERAVLLGLTLTGRALLTSPGSTRYALVGSLMANWDAVQPGLMIGLSQPRASEDLRLLLGLTLSLPYGR